MNKYRLIMALRWHCLERQPAAVLPDPASGTKILKFRFLDAPILTHPADLCMCRFLIDKNPPAMKTRIHEVITFDRPWGCGLRTLLIEEMSPAGYQLLRVIG